MSSKKGVLGKGLNALIPQEDDEDAKKQVSPKDTPRSDLYKFEDKPQVGTVANVKVKNVRPNPYQPRQEFNEEALEELTSSIEELGVIQPVTVRALEDDHFEIISGERRLRAARRAGLEELPAYIREANSEEMLEMALVENVQREELNPIEVAMGYQRLIEECELTQEEVAQKVSKGRATVANFLRLLKLPPRVQAALKDGSVSVGHARALINVEDEEARMRILNDAIDKDLTVRQVEERVRNWRESQSEDEDEPDEDQPDVSETPSRDDLQLNEYRNQLRSRLSTQVRIKKNKDGEGQLEIAFYSNEDLERLMELITE